MKRGCEVIRQPRFDFGERAFALVVGQLALLTQRSQELTDQAEFVDGNRAVLGGVEDWGEFG